MQEIKDSGYIGKLAYGIVLTGGSAKLKDLDELFRRVTGMDVRVASAETGIAEESKEKAADPAYATAVGILLKAPSRAPAHLSSGPWPGLRNSRASGPRSRSPLLSSATRRASSSLCRRRPQLRRRKRRRRMPLRNVRRPR